MAPQCPHHLSIVSALICVCILFLSSTAIASNTLTTVESVANRGSFEVPQPTDTPPNWFDQVQEQLIEQEYYLSISPAGELQAPNRKHNLRTFFDRQGAHIVERTAVSRTPLVGLRYRGIVRGAGDVAPARPAQSIHHQDNRVVLEHGGGVSEWYINDQRGLEHGFILNQRPQGQLPLSIVLDVSAAEVEVYDGQAVITAYSGRILNYGGLVVRDAEGQAIPASIERLSGTRLALTIEDRQAAYPLWVDPFLTAAAGTQLEENQVVAKLGTSVSAAGDINNDGYADVIVGAPLYDNGETDEGAAFVYYGSPAGIVAGGTLLEENQASAEFGSSVSAAGDVNNDGYADVIVGAPLYDNGGTDEGAAFVYYGSISGIAAGTSTLLEENQASAEFGISVSGAGDVNNDGYADVIVGAHLYDNGETDEGAAFVYHGSSAGILTSASTQLEENKANARLGYSVSSAGDVNGDDYADVIAGAWLYENGQVEEGMAFVYHGSASGISNTHNVQLEENQAGAGLGISVSGAGDVNGDGYADVVVGVWLYDNGEADEGAAFVYYGSNGGIAASVSSILESDQLNAHFGYSVSSAGDVNNDGYADIIVGAFRFDNGENNEGTAFIYQGSVVGVVTAASVRFEKNQVGAELGTSVSGAGDVNGDGYADVIVGAPLFDNGEISEGAAFVYHGSSSTSVLLEENQDNANLGISVAAAGDVNGDGYADVIVGASTYDNGQTDEGAAFVYHGAVNGVSTSASTRLEEDQANAAFGISVSGSGDVNGDGYADVIVGAYWYDNNYVNEGAAFVYYGSPSGIVAGSGTRLLSNQANAQLGNSVSAAGDVNGDGYADVIVGAYLYDGVQVDEGAAFVYHGSASGVSAAVRARLEENQFGAGMGWSVSAAGDVNGDGYGDVIVGAWQYDNGETDEGAAFVYHGSASGVSGTFTTRLEENQAAAMLGTSVAAAGDVNGDGYADVIVGAPLYDNGETDEGLVFVYHGSDTGVSSAFATQLEGNQQGAHAGWSVSAAGDINGDGYGDVIVGTPEYSNGEINEGLISIYHGASGGVETVADIRVQSNQLNAGLGRGVSSAGDVNGDGYADVIVGANKYDNDQTNEGAAFVFHGSADSITISASTLLEENQMDAGLGFSVSGAGDVNGDGYADVIVGAGSYDNGETAEGAAFVYHGSASGVSGTYSVRLEENQAYARLGRSVSGAGDVNGDGYADVIVGAWLYDNGQVDEGAAFVYHGSASGVSGTFSTRLESNQAGARLGYSVSAAGDVNGDGYSDVIAGADLYDNGSVDEGAAFVYHGSASGISVNHSSLLTGMQANAQFGGSVSTAGDVDGDGYADVIVGAHLYDGGQVDEGAAFVHHGSAGGVIVAASTRLELNLAFASMGKSVAAAGDVNGDGFADVIVGANKYNNKGAAVVYHGSSGGISATCPGTLLIKDQLNTLLGSSVSGAGDVNGDGYADVIVGAPLYHNGQNQNQEGAAFVYYGSGTGVETAASVQLESNQGGAKLGTSVSAAGDVNGDGFADIIVGAPLYNNSQIDEGVAFVYYGNGSAGRSVLSQQVTGDSSGLLVQEWGRSRAANSFKVRANATNTTGRGKVKLQVETCPTGVAFGSAACSNQISASWLSLTPAATVATLTETLSGLTANQLYHWRTRVLHAPDTVTQSGITAPPNPAHGPWRYFDAAADTADVRTGDYPIQLGFVSADSSIGEAAGLVVISVALATPDGQPSAQQVTADFVTTDGSALAGVDYVASIGTMTFAAGSADGATKTLAIGIIDDNTPEASETFITTLTVSSGASLNTGIHTVKVIDDDPMSEVIFTDSFE